MRNRYSDEDILAAARTCTTRAEFCVKFEHYYGTAYRQGLLPKIYAFLPEGAGLVSPYSDEDLITDAAKFSTRLEWKAAGEQTRKEGGYSRYGSAVKRGSAFMQKCCAHMVPPPHGCRPIKYSDQQVIESASQYQHKSKWKKAARNLYNIALLRPAVFKLATAHMTPMAHPYSGCYSIYAYEFQDGTAYIGLSFQVEMRRERHARTGPVFTHQQLCPNYAFQILEDCLPDPQSAVLRERHWIAYYHSTGWRLLNRADGGSLGTVTLKPWTKEEVLDDAFRFAYRTDWIENSRGAYKAAKDNGWFEEAVAHMPERKEAIPALPISDETRAKMSASAQIRAADPLWRSNHSAAMTGRAPSESAREAVRAALKGKPHPNAETWARKKQALIDQQTAIVGPLVAQGLSTAAIYEQVKDAFGLTRPTAIYRVLERCGLKIPGQVRLGDLTPEERAQRRKDKYKRSYQKHREARIASATARNKATAEVEPGVDSL